MPKTDDFYTATFDATLRSWELVHIETDEEGNERGRGMFVSAAFARRFDLDLSQPTMIALLFSLCGGQLQHLTPFVDLSFTGPRIGYD